MKNVLNVWQPCQAGEDIGLLQSCLPSIVPPMLWSKPRHWLKPLTYSTVKRPQIVPMSLEGQQVSEIIEFTSSGQYSAFRYCS